MGDLSSFYAILIVVFVICAVTWIAMCCVEIAREKGYDQGKAFFAGLAFFPFGLFSLFTYMGLPNLKQIKKQEQQLDDICLNLRQLIRNLDSRKEDIIPTITEPKEKIETN